MFYGDGETCAIGSRGAWDGRLSCPWLWFEMRYRGTQGGQGTLVTGGDVFKRHLSDGTIGQQQLCLWCVIQPHRLSRRTPQGCRSVTRFSFVSERGRPSASASRTCPSPAPHLQAIHGFRGSNGGPRPRTKRRSQRGDYAAPQGSPSSGATVSVETGFMARPSNHGPWSNEAAVASFLQGCSPILPRRVIPQGWPPSPRCRRERPGRL